VYLLAILVTRQKPVSEQRLGMPEQRVTKPDDSA
jgi:hypothetical protein